MPSDFDDENGDSNLGCVIEKKIDHGVYDLILVSRIQKYSATSVFDKAPLYLASGWHRQSAGQLAVKRERERPTNASA
ncbi:hypothetical protein Trydic_g12677 [Trypoxylus dichotomus]